MAGTLSPSPSHYIFNAWYFEYPGKKEKGAGGEIQLTDAMAKLSEEQPVFGFKFDGKRYVCGDKAGFQLANVAFARDRPELRDTLLANLRKMLC